MRQSSFSHFIFISKVEFAQRTTYHKKVLMFYILMIRTFQKSAALLSCFAWKWLCLLYRPNQNKRIPCVLLMLTHSLPNWSIPQLRQRRCLFSSVDKKCMYSRILMSTWQNMIFHWVFVVVAFNVVVFFDWCIRRELMFTSNQVLSCSISDSLPAAGVQPFHQNTEKNKLR